EKLLKCLFVELRIAGRGMSRRLFACRDTLSVPDARHRGFGYSGLRRVALVVGSVDQQERSFNLLEIGCGIVVGGGRPLPNEVVGVGGHWRGKSRVNELVGLRARRRLLLIIERAATPSRLAAKPSAPERRQL